MFMPCSLSYEQLTFHSRKTRKLKYPHRHVKETLQKRQLN